MLLPDNSEYKPVEHPNMAPTRTVNGHLSVKERLGSYDEIDQTYTEEEALEEASRCLYWSDTLVSESLPGRGSSGRFYCKNS